METLQKFDSFEALKTAPAGNQPAPGTGVNFLDKESKDFFAKLRRQAKTASSIKEKKSG